MNLQTAKIPQMFVNCDILHKKHYSDCVILHKTVYSDCVILQVPTYLCDILPKKQKPPQPLPIAAVFVNPTLLYKAFQKFFIFKKNNWAKLLTSPF